MPGAGKTAAHLLLGKRIAAKGHRLFVIDTDRGTRKNLEEYAPLKDWEPAQISTVRNFGDVVKAAGIIHKHQPVAGDWIAVEMVNKIWEYAQGHFTEKVWGKDPDDYFVEARRRAEEAKKRMVGNGLDPMVDWTVIKRLYFGFLSDILDTDASVFLTTGAKELVDVTATEESRDMYAGLGSKKGYRPDGNKMDHHQVDTVMFLQFRRGKNGEAGTRHLWTAKDRGRMLLDDIEFTDLFDDYFTMQGIKKPWE